MVPIRLVNLLVAFFALLRLPSASRMEKMRKRTVAGKPVFVGRTATADQAGPCGAMDSASDFSSGMYF